MNRRAGRPGGKNLKGSRDILEPFLRLRRRIEIGSPVGSYFAPEYTIETVERLLGLHEYWGRQGERDITILDLLSWARDPGGDRTWQVLHELDADGWMARRGPLPPDSEFATTLWDFRLAVKRLPLLEQAVIALTVFGFSQREIGQILALSQQRVSRTLVGRPRRDAKGQMVRDEHGAVIYTGGIAKRLARAMNGESDGPAV